MNEMELQTTLDPIEMDMGDPEIVYSPVLPNPEGEPTDDLTKVQIQGNIYQIKDPEVHDWARAEEKPTYTKAEVGLGNVDNTSDMDKPVSTATQTALDNKVDKVAGKGLSEEDFTHTLKNKLDGIEAGAEVNTVNSVAGKTGNITLDKSDVGLGNVDNTSDMNKPVSTATQTALNGKVDNSTLNNYYTKTQTDSALSLKANSSSVYTKTEADNLLNGKVDKVEGKGLSENDFTDTLKSKLDGIEAEANRTIVDNALDGTSANPVENRVVKSALDEKLNADETAVNANGLALVAPVTDTAPYIYRQTPVKESFKALMKKIVGASVVWNQLWNETKIRTNTSNGLSYSANSDHSLTINGTLSSSWSNIYTDASLYIELKPSNVYMLLCDTTNLPNGNFMVRCQTSSGGNSGGVSANRVVKTNANVVKGVFRIEATSQTKFDNIKIGKPIFVDLTAMFGTTIADYVYTLEQATAGSGIAWLQSYGFFTEDYYAYKQNKLESGCVSAHKTYDGETLLTTTELSPITLRGLFGLSNGKLTVDGDEYNADGSVTRKYGIVDLGSLEWNMNNGSTRNFTSTNALPNAKLPTDQTEKPNAICEKYEVIAYQEAQQDTKNLAIIFASSYARGQIWITNHDYNSAEAFKTAMSGVYLIYELATHTTEQTTPFTETEIVGSTEEFIDYEVAQNNRDVAIPVGTDTDYYQEMKLPSLPTTSGNHNLIYNPSTGFGWS